MSFTSRGAAIRVLSGGTYTDHVTTSTSTVVVHDYSSAIPKTHLRKFMTPQNWGRTAYAEFEVPHDTESIWTEVGLTTDADGAASNLRIVYIDGPSVSAASTGALPARFVVDVDAVSQLFYTSVPRQKSGQSWQYTYVGDASTGYAETTATGTFNVSYKDPHVIELPDGEGWLMILTRGRYLDTVGEPSKYTDLPGEALSDIVGWWSPTADFDGTEVVGPFLLVDSLRAWPDADIRLWLGTAGATVVRVDGEYMLMLYYVTEASRARDVDPPYIDLEGATAYQAQLDAAGFTSGTACKRILLNRLLACVNIATRWAPFIATNESRWEPDDAIEGELLGSIRPWILQRGAGSGASSSVGVPLRRVRAFDAVYGGGSLGPLRPLDPCPVACEDHLVLWVAVLTVDNTSPGDAAQPGKLGTGSGMWRMRAVDAGTLLYDQDADDWVVPTYGKDMLLAPVEEDDAGIPRSADQILEAQTSTGSWIDPDVFQLPTGPWVLHTGSQGSSGPMLCYVGTQADGCVTAGDLLAVATTARPSKPEPDLTPFDDTWIDPPQREFWTDVGGIRPPPWLERLPELHRQRRSLDRSWLEPRPALSEFHRSGRLAEFGGLLNTRHRQWEQT